MNLLEVQDDLKNFSQDQLVKEMQQPSGNAPQFLVLSELNRRKRVKGDFEARQAQQQPTVAEEAVASAGVPQEGMSGMSEAMAPASMESGGIGSMMPKTMKNGGEVDRYADGGLIEGIADSVSQNAEALQGIQEATMQNSKLLQNQQNTPIARPEPAIPRPMPIQQPMPSPMPIRRPFPGFGGKGGPIARPAVIDRPFFGGFGRGFGGNLRGSIGAGLGNRMPMPQAIPYAEGGLIRAANGFAGSGKSSDDIIKQMEEKDKAVIEENDDTENISEDVENNTPVTTGKGTPNYSILPMLGSSGTDTVEQDIINLQKGLEKERNLDRNLALAQAGLGIMSSTAPTLAQAIGEGGSKGLEAFRDSNKRYQEGVVDLINARAKIAAGRKKGRLTASQVMSALQKTRGELYGKLGDLSQVLPDFSQNPARENQLKAQEKYLVQLLQEYGVNLPETAAS